MRRRVNMFERSLQKQLAHSLSKGATMLVSPYQVAVAKDREAGERLAGRLREYEEVQEEKVKLQRARVRVLEVMDKVGEMVEALEGEVGGQGNRWYIEDDGYYREEVRAKVLLVVERLKEEGGKAKRTEYVVEDEVHKF